jgi:ABC-2 type transport system permease protein
VNALRNLLLGTSGNLLVDFGVLLFALALGITVAAAILPRLVR